MLTEHIVFVFLLMNRWRNYHMYAHCVLGYTNGMHPTLSKVTMHLNSLQTNYPTHLYKPLIIANGKQSSTKNTRTFAFLGLNSSVSLQRLVPSTCTCKRRHSKALSACTENTGLSGCTGSSIGSCRYQRWDTINFTYTCSAYFFTFWGGNCNWNEWLVRLNNGHCKWSWMQKEKKKAWWECISTKMVHQRTLFVPAKTSQESWEEKGAKSCSFRRCWRRRRRRNNNNHE